MQNRTFRLFVSSTFSDFTQERGLLQTIVFPEIKKYCSSNKLTFQPIDLRWGVSSEAQLDQKTLELCLNEVKSSKLNPHPNFLIMAGDRYGWIPLPYLIEEKEFNTILEYVENIDDKKLLNSWYKLDENQLPASYILNERKDEYVEYSSWEEVEINLRNILQIAVNKSNLTNEQKNRYFTSATEAEVIEGIFKYLNKTPFQNKLLEKDKTLENKDYENVYAYIRNIKSIDNLNDNFIDKDLTKVNNFKNEIKKSISNLNILESNVNLINVSKDEKNGSLVYSYDEIKNKEDSIFVKTMINNLKKSIDTFVSQIKDITEDVIEKYEQIRFKDSKLKDFLPNSRTKALEKIEDYISSEENQTLVVYGKSGLGKSSLMAKAIQNAEDKYNISKKVIYRFVGSTANLSDNPTLLISILKDLNIQEEIKTISNPQTMKEESEKIEEFYYRCYSHLSSLKTETIIFIDAIDQINNEDEFLWLPQTLPNNLKIIISALEDETYPEDSIYFETLKTKTENLYPLEAFENPKELINSLLSQYKRTITEKQMEYLLSKEDSNSPLYLSIATQELRHWKSSDDSQNLASTQKEIIKEFTQNLTTLFHHDEEFVKRVFTYLYLSQGLSESELLEIISTDEEFISKMAPETYHNNDTKELPVVIWARLHTQIKEFLKFEQKDNQETMSFFHREFNHGIKDTLNIKEIHEHLIFLLQKLIVKYQNENFNSNRWGTLYIEIVKDYHIKFEYLLDPDSKSYKFEYLPNPDSKLYKWSFTISKSINNSYIENLMIYCNDLLVDSENTNKTKDMNTFTKMFYFISKSLYIQDKEKWEEKYLHSLITLSSSLKSVELLNDAIKLEKESLEILEEKYIQNKEKWFKRYITNLNVLGNSYYKKNDSEEAIKYFERYLEIVKEQYLNDKKTCSDEYTLGLINLASCLKSSGQTDKAIKTEKESLKILEELYINNENKFKDIYITNLDNLASSFYEKYQVTSVEIKYLDEALTYAKKAKEIIEKAYEKNKNEWVKSYTNNLNNLAFIYKEYDINQNNEEHFQEIINLQNKCYEIRKSFYEENSERWANDYVIILNNLADFWRNRDLNKSIEYAKKGLLILENLYEQDKKRWAEDYIRSLNNFASTLKSTGKIEESIRYSKELLTILEKLYNQDKEKWTENYTKSLNNFALTLNNFALSLKLTGKIEETIKYSKELSTILEKLYNQDKEKWVEIYTNSLMALVLTLNNFASSLESTGKIEESIKYFKDELEILKKLYEQDNESWIAEYKTSLYNLALNLASAGDIEESIKYFKEILEILYKQDNEIWAEDYQKSLNNLASLYANLKQFNESSKFFEKSYEIKNFEEFNNIRYFIIMWIKWYQCEKYLNNVMKIKKLEKLALESVNSYKKKLEKFYLTEIEKIFVEYENYAKNSKNNFEKEKFEIFKRFFYNDKI